MRGEEVEVLGELAIVGGLDPTGGAGVARDLWTARALAPSLRCRVWITALTSQGRGPTSSVPVDPARLGAQLESTWGQGPPPRAVKIGLVPRGSAAALASALTALRARHRVPVVLDPVLRASAGGELGARAEGYARLLPLVDLCTPNLPELAALEALGGLVRAPTGAGLRTPALLVKGGHAPAGTMASSSVTDTLHAAGQIHRFERPRRPGPDVRGTGCALATAIAVGLAEGRELVDAVDLAIAWLDAARTDTHAGPDGRPQLPPGPTLGGPGASRADPTRAGGPG